MIDTTPGVIKVPKGAVFIRVKSRPIFSLDLTDFRFYLKFPVLMALH